MHGGGQPGRPLHERVAGRHHTHHGTQRGRLLKRGQPLDPGAIAAPIGRHVAGAPVLRRHPRDDVGPVLAVVAVRLERAVGVAAATDIGMDRYVARLGEGGVAPRLPLARLAVRRADHHRQCGQRCGQGQVGRQRKTVTQRDSYVELAVYSSLGHNTGCYRQHCRRPLDLLNGQVSVRPRRPSRVVMVKPAASRTIGPRVINPGIEGSVTVTSGALDVQVRTVRGPDLSDSQADSAGSIPVARSSVKSQVSGSRWSLAPGPWKSWRCPRAINVPAWTTVPDAPPSSPPLPCSDST